MRRSVSVTLVLLPVLATATAASAQPGPQDPYQTAPMPPPSSGELLSNPGPQPGLSPPGLSPPGMTPLAAPGMDLRCDDPRTWPEDNQESGAPPQECVDPCASAATWNSDDCETDDVYVDRGYGVFGPRFRVIRGGFGHYFGGHGGHGGGYGGHGGGYGG